jgi:hypothetical protein
MKMKIIHLTGIPLVLSLAFLALALLLLTDPFRFPDRLSRIAVYSLTTLVPVILLTLISHSAGISPGMPGFIAISLMFHIPLFAVLAHFYFRAARKRIYLCLVSSAFLLYLAVSVAYLY